MQCSDGESSSNSSSRRNRQHVTLRVLYAVFPQYKGQWLGFVVSSTSYALSYDCTYIQIKLLSQIDNALSISFNHYCTQVYIYMAIRYMYINTHHRTHHSVSQI